MISLICGIQENQTQRNREQIGSCWGGVGEDVEMGEGGQRIQIFSYKRNKFWECNIQHGNYVNSTVLYI